jgi:outer membrane protein
MNRSILFLALAASTAAVAPAWAQDSEGVSAGDVLVRVRAIAVVPNERSSGITPTFPGEKLAIDAAVMPEADVTWMATDHIGFELIAATTKHTASGRTGTTGAIGDLASTWVLPPTLTVQYHFNPKGKVRPYVGAGLNYTIFYSEKASKGLTNAVGATRVSMSDSFGWAAQAGVDVAIGPRTFLNLDIKYIDMDSDVTLRTAAIGTQKVRAHIDPLVIGAGIGFRF